LDEPAPPPREIQAGVVSGNGGLRRVVIVATRPREGPLTEPRAGAQPWPRERILMGRGGVWRSDCRPNISVTAPFVWRCLTSSTLAPFPHPAHRTGHADFPHPALGQDVTPSPTTGRDQAVLGVRAGSARKGARVDSSRPYVA